MVLGTIEKSNSGCLCRANVLVRTLLADLILNRDEVVIIDFEAGLEHLGRGTSKGIDTMLIVTGPYKKSLDLSEKIVKLTNKMNFKKTFLVGNMIRNEKTEKIINDWASDHNIDVIGMIPHDEAIIESELEGESPFDAKPDSKAINVIKQIYRKLKEYYVTDY